MSGLVFLAAFGFYLWGASPAIAPRDCADMAAAALTLGVAHPPGYPFYAVLGRLWLMIMPCGGPAYRLAVLSCLAGAAAASALFFGVRRRYGVWAGLTAACLFVFSAPMWKFALLQEKYALHALISAALLLLAEGEQASFWRRVRLSAFAAGLGLVNHQSLLLFFPGLLILWRSQCRRWGAPPARAAAAAAPWLLAGLSLYAFIWLRLGSLVGALAVAFRSQYGTGTLSPQLAGALTPARAVQSFVWSLKTWALAASLPAAAAAVAGAFSVWREDSSRATGLLLGALLSGPLFVLLARFDVANWVARSVLEPAFLIPALAAAVFAGVAVSRLGRAAGPACAVLAAAALLLRAPVPERRDDFLAGDYARNLRRGVPPGAALLANGDTALFGLRWLELTSPRRPPLDVSGAALTDARAWLAARAGRADVFVTGLAPGALPAEALWPAGLLQRAGTEPAAAPIVLRRPRGWIRNESYVRDAKLSYAFAAWAAARLLEARHRPVPEALDLTAVALDPDDYSLE